MISDHQPRRKLRNGNPDNRETPRDAFDKWNAEFGFTIDAAASKQNAKCDRFWTKKENGLAQSWGDERVWINPPYSNITPWIEKAVLFEAELAVLLVPVWTDRKWFLSLWKIVGSDTTNLIDVRFLPGRLKFRLPGEKKTGPAPFPCMLLIFRRQPVPSLLPQLKP